ncbi:hypothetical protein FOZ63_011307, partial [Perkinsus olseni]
RVPNQVLTATESQASLLDAIIWLLRSPALPMEAAPSPSTAPIWIRGLLHTGLSFSDIQRRLVDTIFSSLAPSTRSSYATAINSWCTFNKELNALLNIHEGDFPASSTRVALWLSFFAHPGTATNYFAALKKAHRLLGYHGLDRNESIIAVLKALKRHRSPPHSHRPPITAEMMQRLGESMSKTSDYYCWAICVLAYQAMTRVKSELFSLKINN